MSESGYHARHSPLLYYKYISRALLHTGHFIDSSLSYPNILTHPSWRIIHAPYLAKLSHARPFIPESFMNGSEHKQTQLPRKKNKKLKEQATSSMIYPLAIILSNKTIITSVA